MPDHARLDVCRPAAPELWTLSGGVASILHYDVIVFVFAILVVFVVFFDADNDVIDVPLVALNFDHK